MINIEKLESLPFRESFRKIKDSNDRYGYRYSSYGTRLKNGFVLNKYIDCILTKSIGKDFNLTFSKICKTIPKHAQHFVLDEFEYKYYWRGYYYIDVKGNIQKALGRYDKSKIKKTYTFKSFDLQYNFINPINRKIISSKEYGEIRHLKKYSDLKFKEIKISGIEKTFTQQTREYYRLLYNDKKTRKKIERNNLKNKTIDFLFILQMGKLRHRYPDMVEIPKTPKDKYFYYNHRTGESAFDIANKKMAELMKNDKRDNLIKILKHGFDPETSFKKTKEE